ncbi:hypothetical protein B0H19DRAFT_1161570 [Mycena capillaripes]|nr:hypothetical protein B0H19DRAFT_1161570 [Mycena capillaripes]
MSLNCRVSRKISRVVSGRLKKTITRFYGIGDPLIVYMLARWIGQEALYEANRR